MRRIAIALGLAWAATFVIIGVAFKLELYGDGAIFSYAVAAQSSWDFHWHNIAARLFVHVFSHLPAETYIALTGDARGGIALYGALFFGAPLVGLILTRLADRSRGRHLFVWACASTALLCPLVFGCPTEMWFAHAVFWPALALCHFAPPTRTAAFIILLALAALVLTHEGALIFAVVIVATLAIRGLRSHVFIRAGIALAVAVAVWIAVKTAFPPDDYITPVLARASRYVIDPANFTRRICLLIAAALAVLVAAHYGFRKLASRRASLFPGILVVAALAIYWIVFGDSIHADDRYVVRTVLLAVTPLLGVLAAILALEIEGRLQGGSSLLGTAAGRIAAVPVSLLLGALLLVTLIHGVETTKYVVAWTRYASAVRALASGTASDPALGDPRFVSSERIPADLARLGWNSTTPYLSVTVAPDLGPSRLVVDPTANYFWITCSTAMASESASRAVPAPSRALVRKHACLHQRTWVSPAS